MSKATVPAENLTIWREAATQNRTLRHLQLKLLAPDVAAALREGDALPSLPCTEPAEDAFLQTMSTDERVALCDALLQADPAQKSEAPAMSALPASPRVAMLQGAAFATALAGLHDCLESAVPLYLSSLTELLEETAAENADFCLYPIEDAKGTHFLHFYEEFDRLELFPVLGYTVTREDATQGDRFLLLSKHYRPTPPTNATPTAVYRLPGEDQRTLLELLTAADLMHVTLRRADALPAPYPENSFGYFSVFHGAGEDLSRLSAYVSLFMPRVSLIARYDQLTEEAN